MAKSTTAFNWDRVIDELAAAPPQRLRTFIKELQKRRRKVALRRGYRALASISFDDLPGEDAWLVLENEALRVVD